MNTEFKRLATGTFHSMGGMASVRFLRRAGLRILCYHHFPEPGAATRASLARQCRHIRSHYRPVSMDQVSTYLKEGRRFPSNALAVTVDDGYRDFLRNAFPVFSEYKIPAMVYLTSGFLDGECWLWVDQIRHAFEHTRLKSVEIPGLGVEPLRLSLAGRGERQSAMQQVKEAAKLISNTDRLRLMEALPRLLECPLPERPPEMYQPLSWDEVRTMQRQGIAFGGHTRTHPLLATVSDRAQLEHEIVYSRRRVEEELQQPVRHFAYPNGRSEDISADSVAQVSAAGFETAVTTECGRNFPTVNPYLLKRIVVEPEMREFWFEELVALFRLRAKGRG